MRIIVTGGTGFIGSHLILRLINLKHKVILFKRTNSSLLRIKDYTSQLDMYDVNHQENLIKAFSQNKVDLIIHLATKYYKSHQNQKQIAEMNEVNITLPSILLELAKKYNVQGFINTGTCFEYKLSKKRISERDEIEPYNYYAACKIAFEEILKFYTAKTSLRAVTFKLFYPYGERDNPKVIPLIINSFIENKPLDLTPGEQRLNFTYVEDVVDAYIKGIWYLFSPNYTGYETFNIGSDKTHSLKEIVSLIEKISRRKIKINWGALPYPKNEIMYMNCDFKKANKKLSWQPKTDIIKGLRRTYNYSLKHD